MRAYNGAMDAERERDLKRAEESYRQAIQRDPAFCDAMDNLGLMLRRQGRVDEAIGWYRRSLAVQPKNGVARGNLAMALRLKGLPDEALREYATMLAQEPDDARRITARVRRTWSRRTRARRSNTSKAEKLYWVQRPELMADATLLKGFSQWGWAIACSQKTL
jgi:tetratricopeptide (TPR) repeat protein